MTDSEERSVAGVTIECVVGDIASQGGFDAVVYGRDEPSDELLRSCYEEALHRAEEREMVSVAFPAISAGAFGYPLLEAAEIAVGAVVDRAPHLSSVRRICFVLYDDETWGVFRRALDSALEGRA